MSDTSENVIDARLLKRLPRQRESAGFVLDVHLRTGPGITALFGSSGAGKTLTLNCIAGLTRPEEGRILVRDEIYFDALTGVHLPPQRRRCGYIFQDHALFPHMTVRENLRFAASVAPIQNSRRLHQRRRVNELLELFELNDLAGRRPAQLSGGQRQRAALARVLIGEPRLVLLDEPTRGLDTRLRDAFYEVLQQTLHRLNVPALLVTHDLDECFKLAESVCLMDAGRLLQAGPRDAVFSKPATLEVARMLGIYNLLPAEIAALDPSQSTSRLTTPGGVLEGSYFPGHLIGDRGSLSVSEYEVKVRSAKHASLENQLPLRVRETKPVASGMRIHFEHGLCAVVSSSDWEQLRLADMLWVEIPRAAIHFIG